MMQAATQQENSMRQISVEKVSLNLGTGEPGDKLEKAKKLLKNISGMKPISTKGSKRIPTWGVRPGLELGCKVTIRKKKAETLLKQLLTAKKNELKTSSFDNYGNVSFGIPEYLDIEGVEYDTEIGIIGLEVAVTLQRKGFRIKRRALNRKQIPKAHQITQTDAMVFMKEKFGVKTI